MNAYYDRDGSTTGDDNGPTLFFEASGARPRAFYEAAALLALYSLLIIHEAAVRLIQSRPFAALPAAARALPPLLPLLSALAELLLGLLGLLLALPAFVLNIHSPVVTKACMALQVPLSLFVLAVHVFAARVVAILALPAPLTPGMTLVQSRCILCFGLVTAFALALALYGGHFLFMARLVAAACPGDLPGFANGGVGRPMAWNANLALVGACTALAALFVMYSGGGGSVLRVPYVAPPHVGRLPLFAFLAGVVLLFWGLAGALISCSGDLTMIRVFVAGSVIVYLVALANFALLQLALLRDGPAALGGTLSGLVFAAAFLGPYFMVKQVEEKGKFRMSMDRHRSFRTRSESWVELERNFELEKV